MKLTKVKCAIRGCKNRFMQKQWNHVYCTSCTARVQYAHQFEWEQRQINKNPEERRKYHRERARKLKINLKKDVLSYYGKGGRLCCSWRNCKICDLDMLSIDHVENNGKKEEGGKNRIGGSPLYQRLKNQGFPEGFQTLCFNHQFKKEILRRRKLHIK
jgi:hypothetical protein